MNRLILLFILPLAGCVPPGSYGNGPASDGEQQEMDRIKRERGAAKIEQRESEENLRRLNPMGGG